MFYILFIKIYRMRPGLAFCYTISIVIFLYGVRILFFRSSSEADDENSDGRRVAEWQRSLIYEQCHMSRKGDALKLLPRTVKLPENSIFFHETSCEGDLTSRQACVVESAAKAHPNHQINVFFTSAVTAETLKKGRVSTIINNYKNVKLARILIEDYAKGSPLATKLRHMPSDDLQMHMPKIMKYLTLYKFSGIYLSLDVMVARKFDLLPNWVVKDSPNTLSSDMFAFSKNKAGRALAKHALSHLMSELQSSGKQDLWIYSQPTVISKLLETWCYDMAVKDLDISKCNGVAVYSPELFFPIPFYNRTQYFQKVDWANWRKRLIYTYFVWHRFTRNNIIPPESLYGSIANEYCPITYQRFSDASWVWYPDHKELSKI